MKKLVAGLLVAVGFAVALVAVNVHAVNVAVIDPADPFSVKQA